VEEPWQHLVTVLRRHHLRELADDGETETTIPEGLDELREALDQLGGGVPVERGALRQTELRSRRPTGYL